MLVHSFPTTYIFIVILSLTCGSLSSVPIRTEQSNENFVQNQDEFIPTNEWQIVKEGQAIPPGLHVRLNLQTGLREAKLLDKNEEQKESANDLVPVSNDDAQEQERISRENLERAFANLDLSKDDVTTDEKHEEEVKAKYRPYDELKKDFEQMNMKVQTDHELLTDLLKQLNATNNNENRKTILTDLEFYLHQYDNAILFSDMHGLELLIQLLNSTNVNNDVRHLTCLTLGAAFQGNPKVQLKALNLGFVPYLLRLLNIEVDDNIRFRLMFTLSTLLRNFPQAQRSFLEHGGIETIVTLIDQTEPNNKIQLRAIELMNDLIVEKDQETADKRNVYDSIDIRDRLVKYDWCAKVSHRLTSNDMHNFDQIERLLTAMISFTDVCRTNFMSLLPMLEKLNDVYTKANPNEVSTFTDLLTNLRAQLKQTSSNDL
ncbi:unnamed protein product [Adineta ricciae]|uniref:Nucleotide exchange factor SIL1 n=1 Tax=Adineta ricciae TaxID=249248 RepID=A0A814SAZ0_ADIRI|nr:unnamed protein product [Adineta ricciae]CAF1641769.1 unnamed protein product [Adineta ricciae]